MAYTIHTVETAPQDSKETLRQVRQQYNFIPNALGVMAESPSVLNGYLLLGKLMGETALNAVERQIVLLAASFANGCDYCMAAHSIGAATQNVSEDIVTALRDDKPIGDRKLEALRRFAFEVAEHRGYPSQAAQRAFEAAGYTRAQALEVLLGVAFKTLSNYTNHLAKTPLDDVFKKAEWHKPAKAA